MIRCMNVNYVLQPELCTGGSVFMTNCNYDCSCWVSRDESFCFECQFFTVSEGTTADDVAYMKAFDLGQLYVCQKRHYIKHAYSGGCKDFTHILSDDICVINKYVDHLAVEGKLTCDCCNRVAEKGKGRIFFWGGWLCHECENLCGPSELKCCVNGRERDLLNNLNLQDS